MSEVYTSLDASRPDPRLVDTEPYGIDMRIGSQKPAIEVAEGRPSVDIDGVVEACADCNCDLVGEALEAHEGYRVPLCPVVIIEKDDDDEPVAAFWSRECRYFEEPMDEPKEGMDEPNRKMVELMASSLGVESDRVETMPSRTWTMDNGTAVTMDIKRYWLDYAKKPGDVIKPWSIDVSVVTYTPQPPSEERWAQYVQDNDPRAWPPIEARSAITEVWLCPPGDGGIYNMWHPSDKPNAEIEVDRLEEKAKRMEETAKELGLAALGSESDR